MAPLPAIPPRHSLYTVGVQCGGEELQRNMYLFSASVYISFPFISSVGDGGEEDYFFCLHHEDPASGTKQ